MKRINLTTVDRPQVDIDLAGHVIQSTVIANAKKNPNFQNPVIFFDVVRKWISINETWMSKGCSDPNAIVALPTRGKIFVTSFFKGKFTIYLFSISSKNKYCEKCFQLFATWNLRGHVFKLQELPENERYCPPLTIRVRDCRTFGRFTLVGTHVLNSLHRYLQTGEKEKEKLEKAGQTNRSFLLYTFLDEWSEVILTTTSKFTPWLIPHHKCWNTRFHVTLEEEMFWKMLELLSFTQPVLYFTCSSTCKCRQKFTSYVGALQAKFVGPVGSAWGGG